MGRTGVTAQTTAGNPERHTPRRRAGLRSRTNNTKTGAHEQGPKQPTTTRSTQGARVRRKQTKQHTRHPTALIATKKKRRLHYDIRKRSDRSTAPTATTEAPGKPPAPEPLPGPRLPPPIPASHQRHYNINNTSRTSPWGPARQGHALPYNY